MKTLYLHIGLPKTGTSALQTFLIHNREFLSRQRIFTPKSQTFQNLNNEDFALAIDRFDKNWLNKYLKNLTRNKGKSTYIISCEQLFSFPLHYHWGDIISGNISCPETYNNQYFLLKTEHIKFIHNILKPHFDKIVVLSILRRQDIYLNSRYIEDVQFNNPYNLEKYLSWFKNELYFYENIKCWEYFFGNSALKIETYDEVLSVGGIEEFMVKTLCITKGYKKPQSKINTSINTRLFFLKRRFNNSIVNINYKKNGTNFKFHSYTQKLLCQSEHNSKPQLVPYDKAIELLDQHNTNNNKLAKEYLNRETLFKEQYPNKYTHVTDTLDNEEYINFLSSFIFMYANDTEERFNYIRNLFTFKFHIGKIIKFLQRFK